MALFLVPRYVGDGEKEEENDLEKQPRALLLQRLQERARTRELQKTQRDSAVSAKLSHLEREILESEDENGSKEAPGKRKSRKRDGSPLRKVCRKRRTKPQEGREENLGEADTRSERDPETNLEDNEAYAKESRDREMGDSKELAMPALSPNTTPSPSLIVLGHFRPKTVGKVKPLLPQWLTQPQLLQRRIKENLVPLHDVPAIHPKLVKKLRANGIESLFPVQAEVIPAVLVSGAGGFLTGRGGYQPSDFCVSAPTGSGKTLAFVIPVVQALLGRVVCQVRALVVLPTKELAQQVSKVFNIYTDGTGLKVVQLMGQKSFAKEQESLVEKTLAGFRSLADIVVATPGRLVDHLQQTPQFSLRQLRFLVIDEADRMIDNMHQNWLQQVTEAVYRAEEGSGCPRLFRRTDPRPLTAAGSCLPQLPFQKLLFSATLTQNMEKLQPLGLYRPRLFMPVSSEEGPEPAKEEEEEEKGQQDEEEEGENKYTLPEGLSQYFVPCSLRWKPLYLLYFLLRLKFSRVLCFVNSKETSHRLFLLIQAFGGVSVAEFSSRLTPSQRKGTLKEFERGKIQLLISTDATARGIDVMGVKCVISYDAPQFIRSYIHRVGRTARAGKAGLAFTMLLKQQESKFLRMLRDAGLPVLERQLVRSDQIRLLLPRYEEALAELQKVVKEERAQKRS